MMQQHQECNAQYKSISRSIEQTTNQVNVHLRNLDRLKKKMVSEEKKNAINLLKSMRIETGGAEIPFSKPRKRGITSKFSNGVGLKSEDLADEYLVPLKQRYPETGCRF
ncbi:predicted protein [Naegleria gruberi]|uniref:Predicted protein n=1 Tax=Naegleria gruberi TaxID=5762 RepID=D2W6C9_NAEGR|nr:uncharacterized protein NAEGRDRAFT_76972 [Naegleria gruberi]EFC35373.1 predicted protein [Naegleria gruberi]|eukprot:XP_002668117.1 predicted protein [Naegleria gruberi strain NEG-M]